MVSRNLIILSLITIVSLMGCQPKKQKQVETQSSTHVTKQHDTNAKEIGFDESYEQDVEPVEIDIIDPENDTADSEQEIKSLEVSDSAPEYISFEEEVIYFE